MGARPAGLTQPTEICFVVVSVSKLLGPGRGQSTPAPPSSSHWAAWPVCARWPRKEAILNDYKCLCLET